MKITDAKRAYNKRYYEANRERINEHEREKYKKKSAVVRKRTKTYYLANRTELLRKRSAAGIQRKITVFEAYGGAQCVCGEKRLGALTIDHIGGGGKEHRAQIGSSGDLIYRWLIAHGFPPGFRVLCANCNILAHKSTVKLSDAPDAKNSRRSIEKTKRSVMSILGGKCAMCDKSDLSILTVHHVAHDGAAHRKSISNGQRGVAFYRALLSSNNFDGLQCLCFSCNFAIEWDRRTKPVPQPEP